MKKILNRRNLLRIGVLVLAALVLAAGLVWLIQRTLPPVYLDQEVDFASDPGLPERVGFDLDARG